MHLGTLDEAFSEEEAGHARIEFIPWLPPVCCGSVLRPGERLRVFLR